jgi:hypothetical protein
VHCILRIAQHLDVPSTLACLGTSGRFVDPMLAPATGSGTSGERALFHAASACSRFDALCGAPMLLPSALQRRASGAFVFELCVPHPPPLHSIRMCPAQLHGSRRERLLCRICAGISQFTHSPLAHASSHSVAHQRRCRVRCSVRLVEAPWWRRAPCVSHLQSSHNNGTFPRQLHGVAGAAVV